MSLTDLTVISYLGNGLSNEILLNHGNFADAGKKTKMSICIIY